MSWNEEKYDLKKPLWNERISRLAEMIDITDVHSVMDLGAGNQSLSQFIPDFVEYIPVDYIKREYVQNVEIADFNKREFICRYVDCMFVSGVLEYVTDYKWFIKMMCLYAKKQVLIVYNTYEATQNMGKRQELGWICHITDTELENEMLSNGFVCVLKEEGKREYSEIYYAFKKTSSI